MTTALTDHRSIPSTGGSRAAADNDRRLRTLLVATLAPLVVVVVIIAVVLGLVIGSGVLGLLIGLLIGLVIAAAMSGACVASGWGRSGAPLLARSGARRADRPEDERTRNLVQGLSVVSGAPEPGLYVVDDAAPNMAVFGHGPDRTAMIVTSGLVDLLDRVELEGVLAHGFARIRDHDTGPATFAATLARFCPRGLAARVLMYAAPRENVDRADLTAVGLTRYPPGLVGALTKIAAVDHTSARVPDTERHLWFVDPRAASPTDSAGDDGTHPSLVERIERLREL